MKVQKISNISEFKNIKKEWSDLLHSSNKDNIFLTFEWFISWWESFSSDYSLEILLFFDPSSDKPYGIAPLCLKKDCLCFLANREVTDYCDFICKHGKHEYLFHEFFKYIISNYPDLKKIELLNIPSESITLRSIGDIAAKYGFNTTSSVADGIPILTLPQNIDEYFAALTRKNRHELRRKIGRLKSLNDIHIDMMDSRERLESAVEEFIFLHENSGPHKKEFWEKMNMKDFFRRIVTRFSEKNWVQFLFLYHKENLIAVLLSFVYQGIIYFYNTSHVQKYSKYSPGYYLFYKAIKKAIEEKKDLVNFLRGREKYKFFFGAKEGTIHDLTLTSGDREK